MTLVVLAVVSVLTIWSDHSFFRSIDWIVWMLFVIDIGTRFVIAPKKWAYIKNNPFDVIAVIPFDAVFQLARIARLIRVLRLLSIGRKYGGTFFRVLRTNNLDTVISITIIMILAGSIPIYYIEPDITSYADAVWWSIVTTTTVGYGDISPATGPSRMIAVVLMIVGIGTIGMITGSIASFFIKEDREEKPSSEYRYLRDQLERMEELSGAEVDRMIAMLESIKQQKADSRESAEKSGPGKGAGGTE
ncbi:ion transporter [Alkalicoccus urumqiensis]|uniref:Ion transporter n=2 Tax=Alkalicoccus urumqiensis TaxID=1548213 RepID=A0A2P6MK61_ALKUR|nr:ion transporter [Alkalicoccus urumqiensis]